MSIFNQGREPEQYNTEDPKKPAPRFSPVIRAAELGKPLPEPSRDRAAQAGPNRVYDASLGRRVPKETKRPRAEPKPKTVKPTKSKMEQKTNPADLPEQLPAAEAGIAIGGAESTKNYEMFTLLPGNRPIDMSHVRSLAEKIRKKNLLNLCPIIVNEEYGIIEGQHRREAARLLGVSIFYIVSADVRDEDIAALNSNKKNWVLKDYIHFHSSKGNQAYIDFQAFCNRYPWISPAALLNMCAPEGTIKRRGYQEGLLDVSNMGKAEQTIKYVLEIAELLKQAGGNVDIVKTSRFIEALSSMVRNAGYDQERMIKQINKDPARILLCSNLKQYVQQLQQIFNKGMREENLVMFIKR